MQSDLLQSVGNLHKLQILILDGWFIRPEQQSSDKDAWDTAVTYWWVFSTNLIHESRDKRPKVVIVMGCFSVLILGSILDCSKSLAPEWRYALPHTRPGCFPHGSGARSHCLLGCWGCRTLGREGCVLGQHRYAGDDN